MVTRTKSPQTVDSAHTTTGTFFGLSTDSKPSTGVGNGSCFLEMDTGKIYFFDAAGGLWREWGA